MFKLGILSLQSLSLLLKTIGSPGLMEKEW